MRHVSTKQAARAVLYKNSTFYCSFITGIDLKKKKDGKQSNWKIVKLVFVPVLQQVTMTLLC